MSLSCTIEVVHYFTNTALLIMKRLFHIIHVLKALGKDTYAFIMLDFSWTMNKATIIACCTPLGMSNFAARDLVVNPFHVFLVPDQRVPGCVQEDRSGSRDLPAEALWPPHLQQGQKLPDLLGVRPGCESLVNSSVSDRK